MTPPTHATGTGSYDDLPEGDVRTVINVPLSLGDKSLGDRSLGDAAPAAPSPGGRHRATPRAAHRAPRTIVPIQPHRGPVGRFLRSDHPVRMALTVGLTAALIVVGVVATTMLLLTWLVA